MRGCLRVSKRLRACARQRSILLGITTIVLVALVPAVASAVLTLTPHSDFAAGAKPGPVRVGDFNGDGKQDLAIANAMSSEVSVLLGTGTGSFATASSFRLDGGPNAVAVGDFNSDGNQDLVIADWYSGNIPVLLGHGDGTFGAPIGYGTGIYPSDVAVGDFNSDGKQDLAVSYSNLFKDASAYVEVLLGDGTGSFEKAGNLALDAGPWSVAIGDFNADGKQDLAVTVGDLNKVSVFLGNGNGTFAAAAGYSVGTNPGDVEVGDFNSDGKQDLAVSNNGSNNVSLLLGDGTGSFATAINLSAGTYPSALAVGDFNGDGSRDIAVTNYGANTVSIILNAPTADPSPGSLVFGSASSPILKGTAGAAQTVKVTNNGSAPLAVSGFAIDGSNPGDFVTTNNGCANRVAPGSSCSVRVRFTPKAQDSSSAALSVLSNAPSSTSKVTLTGFARAAGKIVSAKLSKKSFSVAQVGKVKLRCKFSPKSKAFKYVLLLQKGKKWTVVKRVNKTGSFTTYTDSVKKLFAGKRIKDGSYRLKLTADANSKTLRFKITSP